MKLNDRFKAILYRYVVDNNIQDIDTLFTKDGYAALEDYAYIDNENYSRYGFIIDNVGNIVNLKNRFSHGLVLSIMNPDRARKFGIDIPRKDKLIFPLSAYIEFQCMMERKMNIITVSGNDLDCICFDSNVCLNKKQINALEIFIQRTGLNEEHINCCMYGVNTGNALLRHFKQTIFIGEMCTKNEF